VAASPTSVASDGVTTSTITVTLRDAASNPLPGKTVTLASSRPADDTISAASGLSSVSGVVTFMVKSSTAGSSVFTATDVTDGDLVISPSTATVTFTAGAVSAANSTVTAAPESVVADGATASTITVTLKNGTGAPVAGKTVSLAKTSGPGNPVITPAAAGSEVTNASGVASFTVASTTAAADVFTATDDTPVTVSQTATVTFTVGTVDAHTSTVTAAPATIDADDSTTATLTVTLLDHFGNPVPGKTVALVSSRTPGTDTISAASGLSSAAGVVTFTVKSATAGTADFSATDTDDGVTLAIPATVTFAAVVPATIIYDSTALSGVVGNTSLDFVPAAGNIYTASYELKNAGVDENLTVGFGTSAGNSSGPNWWYELRAKPADGEKAHTSGGNTSTFPIGETHFFKIVLDTTAADWTTTWYMDGVQKGGASTAYSAATGITKFNAYWWAGGPGTIISNFKLSVVAGSGGGNYASWAAAQTPPLTSGPTAVGNDGIPNLLVYALALKTDGTNGSPGKLEGNKLTFTKRPDAVTNNDVTYSIETSTDLGVSATWKPATGVVETTTEPYTISYTLPSDPSGKLFARLVVTQK